MTCKSSTPLESADIFDSQTVEQHVCQTKRWDAGWKVAEGRVSGRVGVDQQHPFSEVGNGGGEVDRRRALADPPFAFVTATLRIAGSSESAIPLPRLARQTTLKGRNHWKYRPRLGRLATIFQGTKNSRVRFPVVSIFQYTHFACSVGLLVPRDQGHLVSRSVTFQVAMFPR